MRDFYEQYRPFITLATYSYIIRRAVLQDTSFLEGMEPILPKNLNVHKVALVDESMKVSANIHLIGNLGSTSQMISTKVSKQVRPEVLKAFASCYIDVFSQPPYSFLMSMEEAQNELLEILSDENHLSVLLTPEDEPENVKGFAVGRFFQLNDQTLFFLEDLGVSPATQGQGLGRKLMSSLLDQLPDSLDGVYLTTSTTNENARRFYGKNGFAEVELQSTAVNLEQKIQEQGNAVGHSNETNQCKYVLDSKVFFYKPLSPAIDPKKNISEQAAYFANHLLSIGYIHNISVVTTDSNLIFGIIHGGFNTQILDHLYNTGSSINCVSTGVTKPKEWQLDGICLVTSPETPDSSFTLVIPYNLPKTELVTILTDALSAEVSLPSRANLTVDVITGKKQDSKPIQVDIINNKVQILPDHQTYAATQNRLHKGSVQLSFSHTPEVS